jgi:hypothetical protein
MTSLCVRTCIGFGVKLGVRTKLQLGVGRGVRPFSSSNTGKEVVLHSAVADRYLDEYLLNGIDILEKRPEDFGENKHGLYRISVRGETHPDNSTDVRKQPLIGPYTSHEATMV